MIYIPIEPVKNMKYLWESQLCEWVVATHQAFLVVDNQEFSKMVSTINGQIKV